MGVSTHMSCMVYGSEYTHVCTCTCNIWFMGVSTHIMSDIHVHVHVIYGLWE